MNWPSFAADVRDALRVLARQPLFALLAIAALALGIGANTAIFTIVNGVLLTPLPYDGPADLVMVWSTNALEKRDRDAVAPLDFLDYRRARALAGLQATYSFIVGTPLTTSAGTEQMVVTAVTPGMFEMLGRRPAIGRTFTPEEVRTAVVISHRFWRIRLGGDPNVIGRVLTLQHQPRTIVGVMPDDFVFPYKTMLGPSGFLRTTDVEAWLPLEFVNGNSRATGVAALTRDARFLSVIGRLAPGATRAQADAELSGIARQLAASYPDSNRTVGVNVVGLHEQAVGEMRPALVLLLGGVGFVLLMACVNLANLLLARGSVRRREMAIRSVLGAERHRLIAHTLAESIVLALAGGAVAIAVVSWSMTALLAMAPGDMPRIGEVHVDGAVLAFTFALSLLTGLAIGVVPALAASRPDLQSALTSSSRGATAGRGQRRLRGALVVAEVGLAVVLTLGAGLLLRSFLSVLAVDPGFRPDNLLTLQIALPQRYATPDQRRALYETLFARLDALPGVTAAGGTTRLPLGSTNVTTKIGVEGRDLPPGEWPEVEFRRAVHHYFEAMAIPVLRGRGFTADDGPAAPSVVVINQTMARQLFPNEDPVGRRVRIGTAAPAPGTSPWSTIVGVIGNVRHSGLEAAPSPELYMPAAQGPPANPFIVVRTSRDPAALASAVRAEVNAVDKTISAYDIRTMAQVRSASMSQRRFVLTLVAAFGVLALIMAAVGVYGVMALVVSERSAEIGIWLALGAQRATILWMVIGEGVGLASGGVALGLAIAVAMAPLVRSELYGISALDPVAIVVAPALLVLVAAVACYLPARRATAIDPATALRA